MGSFPASFAAFNSLDSKYLVTCCNRTIQIYDTKTGEKTWYVPTARVGISAKVVMVDDSAGKTGDLYIRSVRFSPDGRYLATGARTN
jgi:glucose repression regulatory protein TUP1